MPLVSASSRNSVFRSQGHQGVGWLLGQARSIPKTLPGSFPPCAWVARFSQLLTMEGAIGDCKQRCVSVSQENFICTNRLWAEPLVLD